MDLTSCNELTGTFKNRATIATTWKSTSYDPLPQVLSEILNENPYTVGQFAPTVYLSVQGADLSVREEGNIPKHMFAECLGSSIKVVIKQKGESEATALEKQTLEYTLTLDHKGALILHRIFSAHGVGLISVPFRERVEDWLKFDRVR
jgi:hypothetical protein